MWTGLHIKIKDRRLTVTLPDGRKGWVRCANTASGKNKSTHIAIAKATQIAQSQPIRGRIKPTFLFKVKKKGRVAPTFLTKKRRRITPTFLRKIK